MISSYANPLYDDELRHWHRFEVELPNKAGVCQHNKVTEVLYVNDIDHLPSLFREETP